MNGFHPVPFGTYWPHINDAWNLRNNPNMHIVFYSDIVLQPKQEMKKLSTFLGVDLSEEQLIKVGIF